MSILPEENTGEARPAWDNEQLAVVTAPADSRILVTAGPGTGKTAVACGRVAHLITEQDVDPSCVMLLSFTRTAVAEIRNRIAGYVGNEARAAGIRIATLDSTTWSLVSGLDPDAESLFGGYETNIDRLCDLLRADNADILDYLEHYEQVVVDEAQDVLGKRAELVSLIIERLAPTCGVTVLADACQSIYGFTNDDGEVEDEPPEPLLDRLPIGCGSGDFSEMQLTQLHRTSEESLLLLLENTRPIVEAATGDDPNNYTAFKNAVFRTVPKSGIKDSDLPVFMQGRQDMMVLYRTRAAVLAAASYLANDGVPHRLRLSGLPVWLHPWIAAVFSDLEVDTVDESDFHRIWTEKNCSHLPGGVSCDSAWRACLRAANHNGRVRVSRLRDVLARPRPPIEFCASDNGFEGPIFGTIHASKGREAEEVLLFVPPDPGHGAHWDEETRVLYVGATRARRRTSVAEGQPTYAFFLENADRPVRLQRNAKKAQFEIGRAADLDAVSVASRQLHSDAKEIVQLQQRLAQQAGTTEKWILKSSADWGWRYRLVEPQHSDAFFGEMSAGFKRQIFAIAQQLGATSPTTIPHIRKVGVRTVVLKADSARLQEIAPPYSKTGFFLAPVVRAWTMTKFRGRPRR